MKHVWRRDAEGELDELEYGGDGSDHNGPICVLCQYSFCIHCEPHSWGDECDFGKANWLKDMRPGELDSLLPAMIAAIAWYQDANHVLSDAVNDGTARIAALRSEVAVAGRHAQQADARAAADRASAANLAAQYQRQKAAWLQHLADEHPIQKEGE